MNEAARTYITEVLGVHEVIRPVGSAFPVVATEEFTSLEHDLLGKMLKAIGIDDFVVRSDFPENFSGFALRIDRDGISAGAIEAQGDGRVLILGPLSQLLHGPQVQEEKRKVWDRLKAFQREMNG